ncbi:MAG: hypothetical protein SGILL_009266 [Bacillariaceae sp.]
MAPTATETPSEEGLPVAQVSKTSDGVLAKWGEGRAQQETIAGLDASYTDSFLVLNSNGIEPFRKTFGSLLRCDGGVLTIGETSYRIQVKRDDGNVGIERFKSLLRSQGITPIDPIMMQLIKHYAASIPLVVEPAVAADLYYTASRIPRSATEIVLRKQGISVAQPFAASDPGKAVLLHAFRDGYPMILKVSPPSSIKHEVSVMEKIKHDASKNYLVVIEEVKFESATIEAIDANGDSSVPYARVRSGLLMKHFQTTLAQCKIALSEKVLLKYGNQLKRAIQHMHENGYCHLDIKPSNVFLLEGNCFLGDYGAAKPIGHEITEVTRNYYPTDFPFLAERMTDYLLLAKTLLEMYREIDSPVRPMSTEDILGAIQGVKTEGVRDLLTSCFDA